jgi:hypothetical protein
VQEYGGEKPHKGMKRQLAFFVAQSIIRRLAYTDLLCTVYLFYFLILFIAYNTTSPVTLTAQTACGGLRRALHTKALLRKELSAPIIGGFYFSYILPRPSKGPYTSRRLLLRHRRLVSLSNHEPRRTTRRLLWHSIFRPAM